jgi:phosphoglycerate dehydrogenase-like enzyme
MQILMSEVALARLGDRWKQVAPDAQLVTLDAAGKLKSDRVQVASAAPEAAWLSRDLHATPLLSVFADYLLKSSSLRWVQTYQAGLDNPFYAEFATNGVRISQSTAQAPAIAEYTLAHLLSLLHPIAEQTDWQRAGQWRRVPFREVAETRVVLIGYGSIGAEIARRLAPFGSRITVVRRVRDAESGVRSLADLQAILPDADAVILACALNGQTRGLANRRFFSALKPGAILINVARGGLLDTDALREGLEHQRPGYAVLDVFETEPLPSDSWLWRHPQVRVTAHCSNAGNGVATRGDVLFLQNLGEYLDGR